MAAGRWVFPIAVLTFFLFIAIWVSGHPATPAPESRLQGLLRVEPGSELSIEYTAFYDEAERFAYYTTQEERLESLKEGEAPIGHDARPHNLTLPAGAARDPFYGSFLGRKVGETFDTPRVLFGNWGSPQTIALPMFFIPTRQTIVNETFDEFTADWSRTLGRNLTVGDEIPCEGADLWPCRITELDATERTLTYERAVGPDFSVEPSIVPYVAGTPAPTSPFRVRDLTQESFIVYWDLRPGDAFVLPVGGFQGFREGAWRIESVTADTVSAGHATLPRDLEGNLVPLHLIGAVVWYQVTIVSIAPP